MSATANQLRKELREIAFRYRLLADHTTDLVELLAIDGEVMYASPSHLTVLGYSASDLIGHPILPFIHVEDIARALAAIATAAQDQCLVSAELRLRDQLGGWHHVETTFEPITSWDGDVECFIFAGRDVTQQRQIEAERDALRLKCLALEASHRSHAME